MTEEEAKKKICPILKLSSRIKKLKKQLNTFPQTPGLHFYSFRASLEDIILDLKPKTIQEVQDVMKKLYSFGFRQPKSSYRTRIKDTANPEWEFRKDDQVLMLCADFSENSSEGACKMVQTGTKTQEVPIMELVCGDGKMDFETLEGEPS